MAGPRVAKPPTPLSPAEVALLAECEARIAAYWGPPGSRLKRSGIKRSDQRRHNVYVHLAQDDTVLYVGVSLDALVRSGQHHLSSWWHRVANIRIEHFPDRQSALRREMDLIAELNPLYNSAGRVAPEATP